MNDNEIIKGFAVCNDLENGACEKCPYDRGVYDNSCLDDMKTDVYNLINRQKAEIERLIDLASELAEYNEDWLADNIDLRVKLKTAKAEAIKEFAESLKEIDDYVSPLDIDNLVREMTEATP